MSPRNLRRDPSGLQVREDPKLVRSSWNRSALRPVIQGVGKKRGVGAALLAAGLVLSGCGPGNDQDQTTTTTTSAAAQSSANPWDLPLEQRPPLFDPCAKIPVEAVEEGVGNRVESVSDYERNRPGDLLSCGWKNDEVHFIVLSTWKSRDEYLEDRTFSVAEAESTFAGRKGLLLTEPSNTSDTTCIQLFFTSEGTVMVSLDMTSGLSEFKGEKFVQACDALADAISPIIPMIPEGEF